jgi:cell division septation protein DedD
MSSEPEGDQVNMLPKPEQPKTTPSPQDLAAVTPPAGAVADEAIGGKFGTKASDFDAPLDPGMDPTVGAISGAPATSEDITAALPPREAATKPAPTALAPAKPIQPKAVPTPAPAPVPEKPAPAELAPPPAAESTAAPSGVAIQLGSFPNATLAASAWSKIMSANQGLLAEHRPSFNRAEIPGKGTWYRLRVGGFADKAAAKAACEQLAATGQACIIAAK